jgi:CheY-like chemotaxis protein
MLFLMDIAMPRLDGAIKRRNGFASSQGQTHDSYCALTGWAATTGPAAPQEAGFDAHLTKPVNYDAIMTLLTNLSNSPTDAASHGLPN